MRAPHIILDSLPSLCQKLSDLVEVWRSYNKNNFASFFWDTVYYSKFAMSQNTFAFIVVLVCSYLQCRPHSLFQLTRSWLKIAHSMWQDGLLDHGILFLHSFCMFVDKSCRPLRVVQPVQSPDCDARTHTTIMNCDAQTQTEQICLRNHCLGTTV